MENPKNHFWWKINKRGRLAYVILCFEEILIYYQEYHPAWSKIVEKMWSVTNSDFVDEPWYYEMRNYFPDEIIAYKDFTDALAEYNADGGNWYRLTEEDFLAAKQLYQGVEKRGHLKTITEGFHHVYDVFCEDMFSDSINTSPLTLKFIDKMEDLLIQNRIPLPSNQAALSFIRHQKNGFFFGSGLYGKPFDGQALSSYLNIGIM